MQYFLAFSATNREPNVPKLSKLPEFTPGQEREDQALSTLTIILVLYKACGL